MRFYPKKNYKTWTKETSRLAHEAKAKKRIEFGGDGEPRRLSEGIFLGVLRWHGCDGNITQCVVRQGKRANGIRIGNTECGWDTLVRRIRKKLSVKKVVF